MSKEKEKTKAAQPGAADSQKETFEEAFRKLEGIVEKLEDAALPIEESLRAFEEGVRLTRLCKQILDEAEKKVEVLLKEPSGGLKAEPFAGEGEGKENPKTEIIGEDDLPF